MPDDGHRRSTSTSIFKAGNRLTTSDGRTYRCHPRFWRDDGTLVITHLDNAFKVNGSLSRLHSSVLSVLAEEHGTEAVERYTLIRIPDRLEVKSEDLEAILEHVYHDSLLDADAPLERIASIVRVSSQKQLDIPVVHKTALQRLEEMFSSGPHTLHHSNDADAALTLATDYNICSIQKALFYTLATHSNLEHDEPDEMITTPVSAPESADVIRPNLSSELTQRCKDLLTELIAHFTPILFTVATAQHMTCTDVFAETWMPLVIQPALENGGLCRPLETLQAIADLDWGANGLCEECVKAKREEWRSEQEDIWDRMDGWLGLPKDKRKP